MLEVNNLTAAYSTPQGKPLAALAQLSFAVDEGAFVALLGPSGCGKSTLLRIIAGLQTATKGHVQFNGQSVNGVHSDIAMMFQDASLMPWRTVHQNVMLPLQISGYPKAHTTHITQLLQSLGLSDFLNAYPSELSGGMAQRVALARVLVQAPRLLLLDEPFGALDALTREQVSLDLLRVWRQSRQTIVMVTHDIHEAVLLADRVLVMTRRPGRVLADITIDLPRPRQLDMLYDAPFVALARRIRETIDRA